MDGEGFVVPVLLGADDVDIGVYPGLGGGAGAANRFTDLLRQGFGGRVERPLRAVGVGAREGSRGVSDAAEEEEERLGGRSGEEGRAGEEERREELVVVGDGEFQGGPYGHQSNRPKIFKSGKLGPKTPSFSLSLFSLFFYYPFLFFVLYFFLWGCIFVLWGWILNIYVFKQLIMCGGDREQGELVLDKSVILMSKSVNVFMLTK